MQRPYLIRMKRKHSIESSQKQSRYTFVDASGRKRMLRLFVGLVALIAASWGCANTGSIEGGPYDMVPPRLVSSNPGNKATGVQEQSFRLRFDEFIRLDNQQEKLIISPAQLLPPRISANGKNLDIRLEDSLRPNTTYSFYFDDAIVDNNEDNPLEDFSFIFSTGATLDTMQMSGTVLDARTLEPMAGLVMGAYYASQMNDSIVRKQTFGFASKTGKDGRFTFRGLKDSTYRVFALKDDDNNYRYSLETEGLAFDRKDWRTTKLDSLRTDTIRIDSIVRRDTLHRDSLVTKPYTYYKPNNILLRYFVGEDKRLGLEKSSRPDTMLCRLEFVSSPKTIPELRSLDRPDLRGKDLYVASMRDRVIDYWLRDKAMMRLDSLRLVVTYERTDSLMRIEQKTDTLVLHRPKSKPSKGLKKQDSLPPVHKVRLELTTSKGLYASTKRDSLILTASEPLEALGENTFVLEGTSDSVYKPVPHKLIQDAKDPLRYEVAFDRVYGYSYRARIDSAKVRSIYGGINDSIGLETKVTPEAELGQISMQIVGLQGAVLVELLDKGGTVLWQQPASDSITPPKDEAPVGDSIVRQQTSKTETKQQAAAKDSLQTPTQAPHSVTFVDLKPDEYYMRLYLDLNGDGRWTTGRYPDREPEPVYYYPSVLAVKKAFTTSERWEPLAKPLDEQKPEALRKTKIEPKRKREDKNIEYYRKIEARRRK